MTNSRAREICRALGGRWHGGYGTAFCPAHDNRRTPALSLADGRDGRLLAKCHAGCDFREIMEALRDRGLVPPLERRSWRGARAKTPLELTADTAGDTADDTAETLAHRETAMRIWDACLPIEDTLAADYLAGRSIALPCSEALRLSPSCWHGQHGRSYPALVARIDRMEEEALVGVHRTYLSIRAAKIRREPARLVLGPIRGGAVRLMEGQGALLVAEGIETALSAAALAAPSGASVWAALTASGMAGLTLPLVPGDLIIAPDNDAVGLAAAAALEDRARAGGWSVTRRPPPAGFGDWNDVAKSGGGGFGVG
ncbi:MAG: toprim domain-containing protein [Pseudomonadota bacterium]